MGDNTHYFFYVHTYGESIINVEGDFPLAYVYILLKKNYGPGASLKYWKEISKEQFNELTFLIEEEPMLGVDG